MDQKGNGLILGIIIGAFVIILAVGGYYLGKQSNIPTNTPYIQTNPQITSAPQTTIPPKNQNIDTSSWKTYTQAIIPFTVQYPSTWTVFEQNESNNAGTMTTGPTYAVQLRGEPGSIKYNVYFIWGSGFGDGFCTSKPTIQLKNETIEGCEYVLSDGSESISLSKTLSQNSTFIVRTSTSAHVTKDMLLQILSTLSIGK